MRSTLWTAWCSTAAFASVLCITFALLADPPADSPTSPESEKAGASTEDASSGEESAEDASAEGKRVSVEKASERAKLMHNIYSATLDMMHHRYFHGDRASVPARAMEDVFSEIAEVENIDARWIAVNTKAMSINHRPRDEFEKQAAKAIAAGKGEYEAVEDGVYRRAEGISLMNRGCLGCHLGFGASGKTKRFAGLVISIPVKNAQGTLDK